MADDYNLIWDILMNIIKNELVSSKIEIFFLQVARDDGIRAERESPQISAPRSVVPSMERLEVPD